jgi:hypothetical protein
MTLLVKWCAAAELCLSLITTATAAAGPPSHRFYFERNLGQASSSISFLYRARDYTLAIERDGSAVYALMPP